MKSCWMLSGFFLGILCGTGCVSSQPCCEFRSSGYPCFGYHSTCWRPWPVECVTCPSLAAAQPAFEINQPVHLPVPVDEIEILPPQPSPDAVIPQSINPPARERLK
jgi:hypothetical protein